MPEKEFDSNSAKTARSGDLLKLKTGALDLESTSQSQLDLVSLHSQLQTGEKNFKASLAKQGLLGDIYDGLKNNLGGHKQSDWLAERLWSNVLDADLGSKSIEKQFDQSKQALASNDLSKMQPLFGRDQNGHLVLSSSQAAHDFEQSQRAGKYFVGGTAIALSAALLLRGKFSTAQEIVESGRISGSSVESLAAMTLKKVEGGAALELGTSAASKTSDFIQLSKEQLFRAPLSDLSATAQHNMKVLTARVEDAGSSLPRLAFHGAPPARVPVVEDFYLHGKEHKMPFYIASPVKMAEDAPHRLADIMAAFRHADGYAGTPATGKLFAFNANEANMAGMYIKNRPAELPSLFAKSENAGERVSGLDPDLKLVKIFEPQELHYAQPPVDLPDYLERIAHLEQLEVQRLADSLLKAIGH